jgi:hypothetical protein
MHRPILAFLLTLTLAVTAGCGGSAPAGQTPPGDSPEVAIGKMFKATGLSGAYSYTRKNSDGTTLDRAAHFWITGRRFLIAYDAPMADAAGSIVSTDGVTAYFGYSGGGSAYLEPSVASVDSYLAMFKQPAGTPENLGVDPATGATKLRFTIKKTDKLKGASNAYYREDIVYLVKDGKVVGIVTRGTVPEKDGSIKGLDTTTFTFTDMKIGEVPSSTFEVTAPIKPHK